MAAFGESCAGDQDCAGTLVCFANVTWAAEVGFADDSGCACEAWYGYQPGPAGDCQELSGWSFAVAAKAGVEMVIGAILFGRVVLSFVRLARNGFKLTAATTTMLFLAAALLAFMAWRLAALLIFVDPAGITVLTSSNLEDDKIKVHTALGAERGFLTATNTIGLLAVINVALVWIAIAESSKRLSKNGATNVVAFRKVVICVELLWGLSLITLASLGLQALSFLPVTLCIIFCVTLYAVGASRMQSLLSAATSLSGSGSGGGVGSSSRSLDDGPESSASKFERLRRRIRRLTRSTIIGLLIALVAANTYAYLTIAVGFREATRIDRTVHLISVMVELIPVGLAVVFVSLTRYLVASVSVPKDGTQKSSTVATSGNKEDHSFTKPYSFFAPTTNGGSTAVASAAV